MRGDLGQLAERVLLLTVRPNEDTRVPGRDIIEELEVKCRTPPAPDGIAVAVRKGAPPALRDTLPR
jgi:hypothetical protein